MFRNVRNRCAAIIVVSVFAARPAVAQQTGTSSAPAATVITLRAAVEHARTHSPFVAAAHARERGAALARAAVPGAANPFIELRGENFSGQPTTQLPRDVFATISQPIELGGKRAARVGNAEALHDVAAMDVALAEWALTFDVAEQYAAALRARSVAASLSEQHQGISEIVQVLTHRVREGVTPEADLKKFETEHGRLTSQLARARIALRSALLRLSTTIGYSVAEDQLVLPVMAGAMVPAVSSDTDVAARPDVRAAEARVRRAESLAALERARGVPDMTVTAGYKRTSGFDTAVAGVTVPLVIFDRNRVAVAQATGELGAARLELQLVRQRALADAQARVSTARELMARAATADADLVVPAADVRSAARASYAEGRGDVLQLVDAERVYGEASREALDLRLDAALAAIEARLALGEPLLP